MALGNPISESLGVLRAHIAPGLLAAVAHNVNHGQTSLRLFEVGRCFTGPLTADGVIERWGLGIVLTGDRRTHQWDEGATPVDFFDLKGIIETTTRQMAWPGWEWSAGERLGLTAGATALLRTVDGHQTPSPDSPVSADSPVCPAEHRPAQGWAGKLSREAAAHFGIEVDVWIAELDIDDLLPRRHPTARYEAMSRFPGGVRDVALVLPREVSYQSVAATVRSAAEDADVPLVSVSLVEIYQGEEIPSDHRGMTLRFLFRATDRTLTADEIDCGQQALVEALVTTSQASRR